MKLYAHVVRLSTGLAIFGMMLWTRVPAAADNLPEIVPGEIVVGVRAETDSPSKWQVVSSTVGKVAEHIRPLHAYRIHLNPGMNIDIAIAMMSNRPDVLYAEPNHVVHNTSDPNDPFYFSQQYGPAKAQANLAWGIWTPSVQTIIAIVDTGVDNTHPDLTNKILRDTNGIVGFNSFKNKRDDALDDYGHGTHVAGIAAAETNNGIGIAGISGWSGQPGSDTLSTKIMPVKVLDNTGSGTSASVASGITWAADHGAKVINLSLGGSSGDSTQSSAVAYAWNKGCVIVAAAGNWSTSDLFYPAAYTNVISVAATDANDLVAVYSNYGAWVTTAAPGSNVYSTLPTYPAGGNFGISYGSLSGTSMATPHVAGEAALLISQNPALTNRQVRDIIAANTDPYVPNFLNSLIAPGGGRINVYQALIQARSASSSLPGGLVASAGNQVVNLAWGPANGATSYNVYRSLVSGGLYSLQGSTSATSFTDTGVTNGTRYFYVYTVVDLSGEHGYSNEVWAKPFAVPSAPSNLRVVGFNRTEIDLAWNDNSNNELGFRVEYSTDGVNFQDIGGAGANVTTFAAINLTRRTSYWFRVRAYGSDAFSGYSNVVTQKTKN